MWTELRVILSIQHDNSKAKYNSNESCPLNLILSGESSGDTGL